MLKFLYNQGLQLLQEFNMIILIIKMFGPIWRKVSFFFVFF